MTSFPKMLLSRFTIIIMGVILFAMNAILIAGKGILLSDNQFLIISILWNLFVVFIIVLSVIAINNPIKHNLFLTVFVDKAGITCKYKSEAVWSCRWQEIHHFEKRVNLYRNRSLYVLLSAEEEKPFYFEYCRTSKCALLATCPREDLLVIFHEPFATRDVSS